MGKSWHTKKKILKFIGKTTKTPGEISDSLGLAPSTVSEHLDGLESAGAVTQVDNPYVKKWKYYRVNPNFDMDNAKKAGNGMPLIPTAMVVLLVMASFAFAILGNTASAGSQGNSVFFRLTDPPKVPSGTQALNITYSSIQAHVSAGGESRWISGNGSGALNLMNLINTSQVIGTGNVPENASIDKVSFSITSAKIIINGTSYNVTVPSSKLTANVTGTNKVSSNSSVLIDISPVVAAIYTENSTVFVMVPSLKAIVVGDNKTTPFHFGEIRQLEGREFDMLNGTTPKIGITSASVSVSDNETDIAVQVVNNANRTIMLRHVMLSGTPSVFIAQNAIENFNESRVAGVNIQKMPGPEMMDFDRMLNGAPPMIPSREGAPGQEFNDDISSFMNSTINSISVQTHGRGLDIRNLSSDDSGRMNMMVQVGAQAKMMQVLNFIVNSNATLELPFLKSADICSECYGNKTGYALKAGETVTLRFSKDLLFANGHMRITPVEGSKYVLIVSGEAGAEARTNVTVG
jgi:hypothetical protein